jgi:hypothetical protein
VFDIAVAGYILISRYFERKEKESLLKLIESLRNLVEKQKQLLDIANVRISDHQERLGKILEDIRRKNMLLTELLTTIKNKSYEDDIKRSIIAMRNNGRSIDEIAKQFKMSKGEVELILNLYEEGK